MSDIVVLRIVLDVDEDVIRDIAISPASSLAELHHTIVKAFDLDPGEMSSFFRSDEDFNQGEEISMMDVNPGTNKSAQESTTIKNVVAEKGSRMLYVYDYLKLWTFFIELFDVREENPDKVYPYVVGSLGNRPDEAPEKTMLADGFNLEPDDETEEGDDNDRDPYDLEDDWF